MRNTFYKRQKLKILMEKQRCNSFKTRLSSAKTVQKVSVRLSIRQRIL